MLALEGIRVLDFTWVVAGPAATRVLADQGAQVIKVERRSSEFMIGTRRAGLMADLNRNKRSIAINMAVAAGRELAHRLVKASDLVVDNFSARVMGQWGMDYDSLARIKPDIICMSMSGFGHSGPRANFVSYGPTLQALSGFTLEMQDDQGRPAGFGYSYADMAGGYSGALAALVALWHRRRTGEGQFIDLSQFEALVSVIGPAMLDLTVNRRAQPAPRWNPQEEPAAPQGVYRCRPEGGDADRWLAISVRSHSDWRRFVAALGSPQWASDERFRTLFLRMRNRESLDRHISQWTAGQDAWHAMRLLQNASVAAAVVSNAADLCERDPQLKARNFWPPVDVTGVEVSGGGQLNLTGIPFHLSETPGSIRRCAPEVDQDRNWVLKDVLSLDDSAIQDLLTAGAIYPAEPG